MVAILKFQTENGVRVKQYNGGRSHHESKGFHSNRSIKLIKIRIMKKLISILAVVLLSVSAMAQVSTASGSLKTLKSFRLGVCKIVEATKGDAVTYKITGQAAGTNSIELNIALGDADAAVKTLLSLAEYKPSSSDEIVRLNNPGDHTAQYSKFNAVWMIHSPGKQFTVNISRKELKKMAEAITNNK